LLAPGVGSGTVMAISPTADHLVYIAPGDSGRRLYLRPIDAFEATPIRGTDGARSPFFSPEGEWIGFFAKGQLKKVNISGGPTVTLCRCGGSNGDWSPDDRILFTQLGVLYDVPASGGEPRPLTPNVDETDFWFAQPKILPGGDEVLFAAHRGDTEITSVGVYSLSSGRSRILIENGTSPRYVETGHVVYFVGGSLYAIPFDVDTLETRGSPVPLVENVRAFAGASQRTGIAYFDVARKGSLIYLSASGGADRQLVWVDRSGVATPASDKRRAYQRPRLSRDGTRLVVTTEHIDRARDLWILELDRDAITRFSFDPAHDLAGVFSPDGKTIAFSSTRSGRMDLFTKSSDGTGTVVPVLETDEVDILASWAPDSSGVVFQYSSDNQVTFDIGFLDLEKGGEVQALIETPFDEGYPSVSPDGRWLVYVSDESGRNEVFVRPFPRGDGRSQVSTEGGH
jgi:serine/threonine-protein kinase